jgi:hypothetical protein
MGYRDSMESFGDKGMNHETAREAMTINPNPRIVALLDYAIDQIVAQLAWKSARYESEWFVWASEWKEGQRSPARCVDVAHKCFDHRGWGMDGKATDPVHHTLGQLAWGGKEACYSTPASGWLVIRYIADAMTAFGIAFPDEGVPMLTPPSVDGGSIPWNR